MNLSLITSGALLLLAFSPEAVSAHGGDDRVIRTCQGVDDEGNGCISYDAEHHDFDNTTQMGTIINEFIWFCPNSTGYCQQECGTRGPECSATFTLIVEGNPSGTNQNCKSAEICQDGSKAWDCTNLPGGLDDSEYYLFEKLECPSSTSAAPKTSRAYFVLTSSAILILMALTRLV